ncbi:hypothetical protein CQW23_09135 [Capsicum baccatum]|uniref:LRAT domain-containing protein n=1 Tax=Capsicum baccatum TaxID=33114 RepID=A0A2G2WVV1_CAPBA|nr:hypothetical protein CQW23_09135 [Capsicum baccatum]
MVDWHLVEKVFGLDFFGLEDSDSRVAFGFQVLHVGLGDVGNGKVHQGLGLMSNSWLEARKSRVQALEIASGRNASTDSSEVVLHRAETLLSKNSFGNYKVFKNNCEDFAIYCKTGFNLHFGTGGFGASGQVALPYKSDIPRVIWNPPLTQRGIPQPKYAARIGVSEYILRHRAIASV